MIGASQRLEEVLKTQIEQRRDDLEQLARDLVRERSVLGYEEGAQRIVASRLEELGFSVERVQPDAATAEADPLAGYPAIPYDGRGCVTGRMPGSGGGRSLHLNGHVDVVPVEREADWADPPWDGAISQGRLWGRGAGDMKGGLAAYLIAAEAVTATMELAGDLIITSVIEEECGGNGMRAVLAAGYEADATLIGEPTDLRLHHAGVGVIWVRLTACANAGHAQYAGGERSAVERLQPAIKALRSIEANLNAEAADSLFSRTHEHPYNVTLGELRAGVWPSSTPARAVLRARIGFGPELEPQQAQTLVREAIERSAPEIEIEFEGFRARAYAHDADSAFARVVAEQHVRILGRRPLRKVSLGTTDARFVEAPCLCYGPLAGNVHGVDEWVDLDSLGTTALVVALVASSWCGPAQTVSRSPAQTARTRMSDVLSRPPESRPPEESAVRTDDTPGG